MTATEYVVLVDEENQATGVAEKLYAHQNNLLHRAFSIFIFRQTPEHELLLQQRALHKYHSPGLWTNTCCSHPRPGETILSAGQRRLKEELGFSASLSDLGWFQYNAHFANGLSEHEIDHVLVGFVPEQVAIAANEQEVNDCRWMTVEALETELAASPQDFTPWLRKALKVAKTCLG